MSDWNSRFKDLLKRHNIKQREAAKIMGLPVSTVHTWTIDARPLEVEKLKRLCDRYGVSLTWLLTGELDGTAATQQGPLPSSREGEVWEAVAHIRLEHFVRLK